MPSLYDELGASSGVDEAVEIFYRKMLQDARVAHFFDDVDMDVQVAKQKGFLTMVLGGPNAYTGKAMREAHAHLLRRGLDDRHVEIVLAHLGESLKELGVSEERIAEVATLANSVRDEVLGRAAHTMTAEGA